MKANALVIGTIFIDCKGFSRDTYYPDGRNIGTIEFVHGGVGRNVAETLANSAISTTFVSSVDANALGKEVVDRLKLASVNTTYLHEAEGKGMGMWLAILDSQGNLAGSISQMPELTAIEQTIADEGEWIVDQSSHVILELDLNAALSSQAIELAAKYRKPIYGIPGNLDVVLNHKHLLNELACFICNHFEAERLIDTPLSPTDPEQVQNELIRYVDSIGLQSMVITLGEHGSVYYDSHSGKAGYQPVFPVNLIDTTGAGDAFFAGTVMGLMNQLTLDKAVICGTKVAGWTIESTENTCPVLTQNIEADPFFQTLNNIV